MSKKAMNKKAAFELSLNFIVIIIICIVVFSFSVYIVKRFFTHAESIRMVYDERTEKEIERLLDDGSRVAIPFDTKTIGNGEFKTFGAGVLNILGTAPSNRFKINMSFNKAFDKRNNELCSREIWDIQTAQLIPSTTPNCGSPETWLQTRAGEGDSSGAVIEESIRNNIQEKFLFGVGVKNAPSGTYIFDLKVGYWDDTNSDPNKHDWVQYGDTLHKLYVDVP